MGEQGWPAENWRALGEAIAKARRAKGWDQQELAIRSGNSANTISNYERGRASRSRRVPGGYLRVAHALDWSSDVPQLILAGEDPDVVLAGPALWAQHVAEEKATRVPRDLVVGEFPLREEVIGSHPGYSDIRPGYLTALESRLADEVDFPQGIFIRQVKRYRNMCDVSIEELAKRVGERGSRITVSDLEEFEKGVRLPGVEEAKVISESLGVTVNWLVASASNPEAPEEMRKAPTIEEYEAESAAAARGLAQADGELRWAHHEYTRARQAEEAARRRAELAAMVWREAVLKRRDFERSIQYLLGRANTFGKGDGSASNAEHGE